MMERNLNNGVNYKTLIKLSDSGEDLLSAVYQHPNPKSWRINIGGKLININRLDEFKEFIGPLNGGRFIEEANDDTFDDEGFKALNELVEMNLITQEFLYHVELGENIWVHNCQGNLIIKAQITGSGLIKSDDLTKLRLNVHLLQRSGKLTKEKYPVKYDTVSQLFRLEDEDLQF